MTTFFIPGHPRPQGSKRHVGNGRMIESSKHLKPWRDSVTLIAKQKFKHPLDGPILLEVEFVMPRTKAMRENPAPPMIQAPDTDKLIRAINDGLTGVAYADDSQVTTIQAHKRRAKVGENTGAKIKVTIDEHANSLV